MGSESGAQRRREEVQHAQCVVGRGAVPQLIRQLVWVAAAAEVVDRIAGQAGAEEPQLQLLSWGQAMMTSAAGGLGTGLATR